MRSHSVLLTAAVMIVFIGQISFAEKRTSAKAPKTAKGEHHRHKSLHAHEHGAGKLNIVLDNNTLEVEIDSPSMDYLGFEYVPKTAKDKKKAQEVFDRLKDVNSLVGLPNEAGCIQEKMTVKEGKVFEGLVKGEEKNDADAEDEEEDGHSDIGISYSLNCKMPENLKELRATVFKNFVGVKKVSLQSIVNGKQNSSTLTPDNTKIPGF